MLLGAFQRANPLNTDHTANLAPLPPGPTWRPTTPRCVPNGSAESLAMYDTALTLSPNAAHLWNERQCPARRRRHRAGAGFLRAPLDIDNLFDQTYLLPVDFLERTGQTDKLIEILNKGVEVFTANNNSQATAQC